MGVGDIIGIARLIRNKNMEEIKTYVVFDSMFNLHRIAPDHHGHLNVVCLPRSRDT